MAKTATSAPQLKEKDVVVATVDLKRVPRGTTGKVIMVSGLTWIRYWVLFDNGERIGTLHRDKLATLAEWENKASNGSTGKTVGAAAIEGSTTAASAETIGGVPVHLLEKSRLARERWAAKKG
jgi:hypothetical protein